MGKIGKFDKKQVQNFRTEFMKMAKKLADKYEVDIDLGTIRYGDDEMRTKMTVSVRKEGVLVTDPKKFFPPTVGEIVGIDHKDVGKDKRFKVLKVNRKNVAVEPVGTSERWDVSKKIIVRL